MVAYSIIRFGERAIGSHHARTTVERTADRELVVTRPFAALRRAGLLSMMLAEAVQTDPAVQRLCGVPLTAIFRQSLRPLGRRRIGC